MTQGGAASASEAALGDEIQDLARPALCKPVEVHARSRSDCLTIAATAPTVTAITRS